MARLYKKGKLYYAEFYDRTRQPRRKYIPLRTSNKRAAAAALAALEVDYAKRLYDPWNPRPQGPQISKLADAARAFFAAKANLSRSSRRMYHLVVDGFVRSVRSGINLSAVRPSHVQGFIEDRELNDTSKVTYLRHLRVFFRWCKAEGHIETVPTDEVSVAKPPQVFPHYLRPEELDTLLTCIERDGRERAQPTVDGQITWLADVVRVAAYTGLRVSELTNLRWEHVDLERGRLLVRNGDGFKTKSGQERAVPLVGVAERTLKDLRRGRSRDQPHVFVGTQGRRLCPQYVSKRFRYYRRAAGLPAEIHFHSLRHTCASWLAEKGVPLPVIQRILGHSTMSMTLRYAHLSPDVVQAEMRRALG